MIDLLLLEWLGKAGSEKLLILSELLLLVFALLVAIGVLGETTKSTRWQPWHHAFGIIVFIGVAGEMVADAGVFISSSRLQELQEGEVAELTRTTAELRRNNLELEKKVAPRRLSSDQKRAMSAILSRVLVPIAIVSRMLDPEGKDFGDDLRDAFIGGHWGAVRYGNWTNRTGIKGVVVATLDGTELPPEVSAIIGEALTSADIKYETTTINISEQRTVPEEFQPNTLYLLVGTKP